MSIVTCWICGCRALRASFRRCRVHASNHANWRPAIWCSSVAAATSAMSASMWGKAASCMLPAPAERSGWIIWTATTGGTTIPGPSGYCADWGRNLATPSHVFNEKITIYEPNDAGVTALLPLRFLQRTPRDDRRPAIRPASRRFSPFAGCHPTSFAAGAFRCQRCRFRPIDYPWHRSGRRSGRDRCSAGCARGGKR